MVAFILPIFTTFQLLAQRLISLLKGHGKF